MATVYSLICWGGSAGRSVTVSNTTDLVTLTNHGLRNSTGVAFTSGTLPTVTGTPLALNTIYYAKSIAANTFELYREAALTNKIDFTSTGSSLIMKSAYYLGLSDKSRWTTGGVERIYESISAWNSGRASALITDEEVCEVGMAMYEPRTGGLTITVPSGNNLITSLVNGVRSEGFHNGSVLSGYVIQAAAFFGSSPLLKLSRYGDTVDGIGFSIPSTMGASAFVELAAANCEVRKCVGHSVVSGYPVGGVDVSVASVVRVVDNILIGGAAGLRLTTFTSGAVYANNTITKCTNGFTTGGTASNVKGFFYNNISVGNTTANWPTGYTGIEGASNNAGLAGEAWITGGNPRFTIATTDFADHTNNNLRSAAITSPQVEQGAAYYRVIGSGVDDYLRPTYPGSAYNTAVTAGSFVAGLSYTIASVGTTDFTLIGASANTVGVTFKATGAGTGTGTATLNAKIDIGAYEFDLGYGAWPATATISLTDIVSGSRVLITKSSDGSVLYNDVPGTSLSHSTSHIGGFNVVIRKASATPFYREFQASGTTVANQTTTIKCLQQLDE